MYDPKPPKDCVSGWDVRQWSWCPVIPWLAEIYGVAEPPTYSMSQGRGVDLEQVAKALGLEEPIRYEVMVRHPTLPARGVIDILAGSGPYTVAEVKAFRRRDYQHFLTQLRYYAWLVNDAVGPVREAYLIMGKWVMRYLVDKEFLERGREAAEAVLRIKDSPDPPLGRRDRCSICWYRRYCLKWWG